MGTVQEQYLRAWQHVLATADAVDQSGWGVSSPCAGWTAGHVAGHLVDGARQTLALLGGAAPVVPTTGSAALRGLAGENPAAGLRAAVGPLIVRVRRMGDRELVGTAHGELPADQFLTMALVEPVVHGWDVAVATGQPARLDDDAVTSLLAAARTMGDQLAATGMYAPCVPVPAAADPRDQLLALLGRRSAP